MSAKRAKSSQGAWPDDRAVTEVYAEIPSTTAIDLVHESSMVDSYMRGNLVRLGECKSTLTSK